MLRESLGQTWGESVQRSAYRETRLIAVGGSQHVRSIEDRSQSPCPLHIGRFHLSVLVDGGERSKEEGDARDQSRPARGLICARTGKGGLGVAIAVRDLPGRTGQLLRIAIERARAVIGLASGGVVWQLRCHIGRPSSVPRPRLLSAQSHLLFGTDPARLV